VTLNDKLKRPTTTIAVITLSLALLFWHLLRLLLTCRNLLHRQVKHHQKYNYNSLQHPGTWTVVIKSILAGLYIEIVTITTITVCLTQMNHRGH
jgi:membrane-associated PAP2 superfamily phosphatase